MLTTKPRGTNDFLPGEVEKWQALEGTIRDICRTFGYKEIRTPIFEHTELFLRSVGETSDIVEKEMYSFEDKAFRHLTRVSKTFSILHKCVRFWKTNCMPIHSRRNFTILGRCFVMISHRQVVTDSLISLV